MGPRLREPILWRLSGMSAGVHRRYRRRNNATREEREVLNRYAEEYTRARENGMARTKSGEIVAKAREELRGVSTREWDDPTTEKYEIRQWFNRWKKWRRGSSGRGESSRGQNAAVEVEAGVSAVESAGGRCTFLPGRLGREMEMEMEMDMDMEMCEARMGLGWGEGAWDPVFEEDVIVVYAGANNERIGG